MQELLKRKQIRIKDYDYSENGRYFITICTHERKKLLSEIPDKIANEQDNGRGGVLLRPQGKTIEDELRNLTKRYNVEINYYVIMPDHIHMIIEIGRTMERAEQSPAPTVGDMVCAFKSITTKKINKNDNREGRKLWQRNYYEHIIRNENEYLQTIEYIMNNPLKEHLGNEEYLW